MPRPSLVALALTLACACDASDASRTQWLQSTLVLDNQIFLDTVPALARGKFARMSGAPHDFLRGTVGQWARDVGAPGGAGYWPSDYASVAAGDVALVGDPHLENIGSFRGADGRIVVDFNDFDAAGHGPYHFDVRRLALSFHVAAGQLDAPEVGEAAARAVASGYAAEIAALAAGPARAAEVEHGAILEKLFEKAVEDGEAREELDEYTRLVDGRREMFVGEIEPPSMVEMGDYREPVVADATAAPTGEEAALAAAILAAYPASLAAEIPAPQLALKGLSRRLGAGVSSYPVLRLYALVEGPTSAPDDDVLLELKEVFDAAPFPGLARLPSQGFDDDAARVVGQQRAMQTSRLDDPYLGCAQLGARSFRVRDRTKFQRGLDLEKLAEDLADGDFVAGDLVALATDAGRLLARSHARAPKRDGAPALPALVGALAGDGDGFADETAAFVADYAAVLADDYGRFLALLAEVGPSLAYAPAAAPPREP